jgi:surface-anchored protein
VTLPDILERTLQAIDPRAPRWNLLAFAEKSHIYRPNDARISRAGEWMKFALRDLQGPGDISAWQDDQQPPSSWWISSFDGGRTLDPVVYIEPGGHMHLNWGFTAAGIYQATFEASAFINGHGLPTRSDDVTFTFGVEDTGPTPPPGGRARLPFNPAALDNVVIPKTGSLSEPLTRVETNVKPAVEAVSIRNGQSVDRVFASMTSADSAAHGRAAKQQESRPQRIDWFAQALGTNDTLLV